jgi:hypothetical protein
MKKNALSVTRIEPFSHLSKDQPKSDFHRSSIFSNYFSKLWEISFRKSNDIRRGKEKTCLRAEHDLKILP